MIGKTQAMMMMKITVANIIKHYRITSNYKSVKEFQFTSVTTMKTTHPLDCHFIRRNNQKL